jgi:hypothetical protein
MSAAQRRAASLLGCVAASFAILSCAEPRPPPRPAVREVCAPVPPCPTWVTAFRDNRTTLHVYAYDGVSGTPACVRGKNVRVTAYLDEQPVGMVDVPCLDAEASPPPMYRIEGPVVAPGLHELRLDVQTARGVVQSKTLLSLPAFDIPADGHSIHMGAEVFVGIGPDDLAIGPPQVYAPAPL